MTNRPLLIVVFAFLPGCAGYVIPILAGPPRDLPTDLYGAPVGKATPKLLTSAGYALADEKGGEKSYILGAPEQGVEEVEAVATGEGATFRIERVRVRFKQGRLATYRKELDRLVRTHGPPQISEEKKEEPLLAVDWGIERSRPSRFIVHRWVMPDRELAFIGGLEMEENLKSAMEYQLVLVPKAP